MRLNTIELKECVQDRLQEGRRRVSLAAYSLSQRNRSNSLRRPRFPGGNIRNRGALLNSCGRALLQPKASQHWFSQQIREHSVRVELITCARQFG